MDQLLIHNARHIRLANKFGVSKMNRNILALQQNLKNIGETPLEVNFDRSRTFWEVFAKGPKVGVHADPRVSLQSAQLTIARIAAGRRCSI